MLASRHVWAHSYDATNNPRILSILYYLNGKGATWFPLADNPQGGSFSSHAEAVRHSAALDPTVDGLRVEPMSAGDALVFYNFDGKGEPDPYTLHAGLEVAAADEKWIGTRETRYGNGPLATHAYRRGHRFSSSSSLNGSHHPGSYCLADFFNHPPLCAGYESYVL